MRARNRKSHFLKWFVFGYEKAKKRCSLGLFCSSHIQIRLKPSPLFKLGLCIVHLSKLRCTSFFPVSLRAVQNPTVFNSPFISIFFEKGELQWRCHKGSMKTHLKQLKAIREGETKKLVALMSSRSTSNRSRCHLPDFT